MVVASFKEPFLLTRYYFSVTMLLLTGLVHLAPRDDEGMLGPAPVGNR
jgi:hypothetical protein